MSILGKLFPRNEKNQIIEERESQSVNREEHQNIKSDSDDLSFIEESLLKLELINQSHGETKYLTNQLSFYQNQLEEIKKEYIERKKENFILKHYDTRIDYLLKLSILADEIEIFRKVWFYFNELDTIAQQEITELNFEEKKEKLLKLEREIIEYHYNDEELDKKLHEELIDRIEFLLEKEVTLTRNYELYMQLSGRSRLAVERRYLKKLVEKVKEDTYIKDYLKEKNIGSLEFDYEMFAYLILNKNRKEELDNNKPSQKENQKTFIDENIDITILKNDQIFETTALEIFKKRGTKAAISDYAIISGGFAYVYYAGEKKLENRTDWYWTKTVGCFNDVHVVIWDGFDLCYNVDDRDGGVRPALPFSSISNLCLKKVIASDGILEVEYGEYPQKAASKQLQKTLEKLFQNRSLVRTGKKYTRDKTAYNQYDQKFQKETQEEYEYNGKKYVRVKANSSYDGDEFTLSNEEQYKDGDYVWIEVESIKWLVDERKNIAVSEKLLFAGIQFKHTRDYKGDFENTDLKWYLDTYFSKEIIPSKLYSLTISKEKGKQKVKQINDGTGTENRFC